MLGIVLPHRGVLLPHAGDNLLLVEVFEGAFETGLVPAERRAVTRDDGAHYLDTTCFDHFEQLVERVRKRGHALFRQLGSDRRHINADRLQFVERVMGFLKSGLQRRLCDAVIAEGVQSRGGNRVHGVGADQGIDIHGVGIGRILGAGGRPQRALHPGAFFLQLGETVAATAKDALERFVGQLRVSDRSFAQESLDTLLLLIVGGLFGELSELFVRHAVNAADEEAGHRGDTVHRQSGGDAALQRLEVGLSNLLVYFDREDERDVYVQAREQQLLNRRKTGRRARHLDHYVGPIQTGEQPLGFLDRRFGVVGQERRNFQADEPVGAVVGVVNTAQHVGGIANVLEDEFFIDMGDVTASARQPFQLLGIILAAANGLLEDGRVRRHTAKPIFVDQALESACCQQRPAKLIEPNTLS